MLKIFQDTTSALLTLSIVGLVGYATQITILGKDIEKVAESIDDINLVLAKNYDKEDALRDRADFKRELEIMYERIGVLDDRINRLTTKDNQ